MPTKPPVLLRTNGTNNPNQSVQDLHGSGGITLTVNKEVITIDGSGAAGSVTSVFGRTGAVVAVGGDYGVAQVTGAAPLASPALTGVPTAPTAAPGTNNTQIATTAFVQAAISAASGGAISFAVANSPATLNPSSVGTKDWYYTQVSAASANPPRALSGIVPHTKILGGWIRNSFDWVNSSSGAATLTLGGSTSIAVTTNAGDDEAPPLSASTGSLALIRMATGTPLNFGFRFEVPADTTVRNLVMNMGINSVKVTITCRMSDGSVADQTTTMDAGATTVYLQKQHTITYNSASPNAKMIVSVLVTTNYGGATQDVGFISATVA
jgi:hypothetical protein